MDRNVNLRVLDGSKSSSLSARRAWIEITVFLIPPLSGSVALRKESVDRNDKINIDAVSYKVSLSARRAWIEM